MSAASERYRLRPGETVVKKGRLDHWQGEPGLSNALSGKFKITECNAVLTNQRFVCFKRNVRFPFGPLIWLVLWLWRGRTIFFGAALEEISGVEAEKGQGLFAVKTASGTARFQAQTALGFGLDKARDEWVAALRRPS